MIVVPFEPEHLNAFDPLEGAVLSNLTPAYLARLRLLGPAVSAFDNGAPVGSAGIARHGDGIGTLWAFAAPAARTRVLRAHRALERLIALEPLRRLEATARCDFAPACRWLELLGFTFEGTMRRYGPDGADHARYART